MWEYMLISETNESKLAQLLNERGKEKWEAVNFKNRGCNGRNTSTLLKRQKS